MPMFPATEIFGLQQLDIERSSILSNTQTNKDIRPLTRRVAGLCYGLFTLGCYLPLWPLFLVGLTVKLRWQKYAKGTWLESHFEWQKDSLLIAFAVIASSMALSSGMMGLVDLPGLFGDYMPFSARALVGLAAIWLAFRMIFGWVRLHDYRPMGKQTAQAEPSSSAPVDIPASESAPAPGLKSAARSFSYTSLAIVVAANLATLAWTLDGLGTLTGRGDNVMGLVYMIPLFGWAIIGTVVYGVILVTFWTSALSAAKTGIDGTPPMRKSGWIVTIVCLAMILMNSSILFL
jgi:uncharacterized membrane protein